MNIEELLIVENWIKNPSRIMRELIGGREFLNEYIVLQSLMNKTAKYSNKTWKREINQYDTIDLFEEIDKFDKPVFILDVGCGDGNVLGLLKEEFKDSLECCGISVMNHPHPNNISYNICPAEVMPFEWGNKFDIVITHQTFRYILFPRLAIKECIRVTKKGGIFTGYIGTLSEENRIMYNPNIIKQLRHIKENENSFFNNNFDKLIAESVDDQCKKIITKKDSLPHKIVIYK